MTDNKSIIDRLRIFAKVKKGSILHFEVDLGFSEGYIKSIYQKSSALGVDKLVQIYTVFPELNIKWLLTGEGEMLLEENESNEKYESLVKNKVPDRLASFILPMFGDAQAGYIVGYSQEEKESYFESHKLPSHLGQNARGFVVHGESMLPQLNKEDVIFCKRVLDFSIYRFFEDDIYVLVLNTGILVKHVRYQYGSDFVELIPANKDFKTSVVSASDVLEVWRAEYRMLKI